MSDTTAVPIPKRPWKKGSQEGYSMVTVEVQVCRDQYGRVFSGHQLQEDLDRETAMTWPGGGMEMISFALLVEAARREALLEMLLMMSKDKDFRDKVKASPEAKAEAIETFSKLLESQMTKTLGLVSKTVIEEALGIVQTP